MVWVAGERAEAWLQAKTEAAEARSRVANALLADRTQD